jgi:hypothetical protein
MFKVFPDNLIGVLPHPVNFRRVHGLPQLPVVDIHSDIEEKVIVELPLNIRHLGLHVEHGVISLTVICEA